MFTFTKTATSDFSRANRPTKFSSNVNVRLALRCHYAYRRKYYVDVTPL